MVRRALLPLSLTWRPWPLHASPPPGGRGRPTRPPSPCATRSSVRRVHHQCRRHGDLRQGAGRPADPLVTSGHRPLRPGPEREPSATSDSGSSSLGHTPTTASTTARPEAPGWRHDRGAGRHHHHDGHHRPGPDHDHDGPGATTRRPRRPRPPPSPPPRPRRSPQADDHHHDQAADHHDDDVPPGRRPRRRVLLPRRRRGSRPAGCLPSSAAGGAGAGPIRRARPPPQGRPAPNAARTGPPPPMAGTATGRPRRPPPPTTVVPPRCPAARRGSGDRRPARPPRHRRGPDRDGAAPVVPIDQSILDTWPPPRREAPRQRSMLLVVAGIALGVFLFGISRLGLLPPVEPLHARLTHGHFRGTPPNPRARTEDGLTLGSSRPPSGDDAGRRKPSARSDDPPILPE